ncbi:MAG: hypothetical protein JSV16_01380 [Candidatus Hydrogenedentota bacterium]|nr:MAG: hypothetical protein JSV16_01380 [Candidatus Hydrogenedentota bacterium]
MEETDDKAEVAGDPLDSEAALAARKRPFVAIAVASAMLAVVTLLMLLASRQAPPPGGGRFDAKAEVVSEEDYARYILIDSALSNLRTNTMGVRELAIRGYVRNVGKMPVRMADLKCFFKTDSGDETSFELPLVIETTLDDVADGPLMPLSGREFGLRLVEFPDELEPELFRLEVVNVRLLAP